MVIKKCREIERIEKRGKKIKLTEEQARATEGEMIIESSLFKNAITKTSKRGNAEFSFNHNDIGRGKEVKR